jgi:hypothetical protein
VNGRPRAGTDSPKGDPPGAFGGMVAEPHVPGTEFGELQLAIWTRQFQVLRDASVSRTQLLDRVSVNDVNRQ